MRALRVFATLATSTLLSHAQVQVDFSHSYTGAPNALQNTGDIALDFTVDGSGNVTLDASCSDPDPAAYVDDFDGPAGTVSDPAMWGQSFSILLSSTGSGALRVNNTGGGLAVQGGNAQLIDSDVNGVNEVITAAITAAGIYKVPCDGCALILDIDYTSGACVVEYIPLLG